MIFLQLEKLQKRDQIEKTTMAPSKTSDVELNLSCETKNKSSTSKINALGQNTGDHRQVKMMKSVAEINSIKWQA